MTIDDAERLQNITTPWFKYRNCGLEVFFDTTTELLLYLKKRI